MVAVVGRNGARIPAVVKGDVAPRQLDPALPDRRDAAVLVLDARHLLFRDFFDALDDGSAAHEALLEWRRRAQRAPYSRRSIMRTWAAGGSASAPTRTSATHAVSA